MSPLSQAWASRGLLPSRGVRSLLTFFPGKPNPELKGAPFYDGGTAGMAPHPRDRARQETFPGSSRLCLHRFFPSPNTFTPAVPQGSAVRCIVGVWSVGWEWLGDKKTRAWPMVEAKKGSRREGPSLWRRACAHPAANGCRHCSSLCPLRRQPQSAGLGWAGWGVAQVAWT